jgi:hypothetical protein
MAFTMKPPYFEIKWFYIKDEEKHWCGSSRLQNIELSEFKVSREMVEEYAKKHNEIHQDAYAACECGYIIEEILDDVL